MILLILFIAIPMIEIALFIQIGGMIGLGWTLFTVLATAIAGSWLVRQQGTQALLNLQSSFQALRDPTEPLAHGAMILFSGALLLTPGFFTDAIGFALLLPPVRRWAYAQLRARVQVQEFSMGSVHQQDFGGFDQKQGDVIDGDFVEVDPPKSPTHDPGQGPSGWTKH